MDKPPEKPTLKLESPPDWAIALSEKVDTGFRGLRADIHLVANDVGIVRDRVVILEKWKLESEERTQKHSGGLARASEVDAKHDAAIASLHEKVDAIAAKPDTTALIISEVKSAAGTPTGQKVIGAIVSVLLIALTLLGASLKTQLDHIEKQNTEQRGLK